MVSFRLSDEEYQQLARYCLTSSDCRTLSDLARTAMHELIKTGPAPSYRELCERIEDLERQVVRLDALLSELAPARVEQREEARVQCASS